MLRSSCIVFLLLSGCLANNGLGTMADSEVNISRISRLYIGMKQTEVLQIMRQPYSHETFEINDATYDVWFYVTRPTVLGQSRMVPQNLTPLTFKNGELIGWGFAYYDYLLKEEDAIAAEKAGASDKKLEDEELERILQSPSNNKTPPKTAPPAKTPPPPPPPKDEVKKKPTDTVPPKKPPNASDKFEPVKKESMKGPADDQPPPNVPQKQKINPLKSPDSERPKPQKEPPKSTLSMSSQPKKPAPQPTKPQGTPQKGKPLIEKEDADMLDEASDQNFNQS
jgi:outer membrane protein assembly factor BamE (lipoprotein component of BamABCDE complex)